MFMGEKIHEKHAQMIEKMVNFETSRSSNEFFKKPKKCTPALFQVFDSLMVSLNLVDGENDTLSLSSTESYETLERTVRFGTIDIREYTVIQGDHPFCKDSLAMSLGWDYKQMKSVRIDEINEEDGKMEYNELLETDTENNNENIRLNNVDHINTRPKRLNYFERRLVLEQVGYKVEDCYGDIRSSIWIGVDNELPPDNCEDYLEG